MEIWIIFNFAKGHLKWDFHVTGPRQHTQQTGPRAPCSKRGQNDAYELHWRYVTGAATTNPVKQQTVLNAIYIIIKWNRRKYAQQLFYVLIRYDKGSGLIVRLWRCYIGWFCVGPSCVFHFNMVGSEFCSVCCFGQAHSKALSFFASKIEKKSIYDEPCTRVSGTSSKSQGSWALCLLFRSRFHYTDYNALCDSQPNWLSCVVHQWDSLLQVRVCVCIQVMYNSGSQTLTFIG